jgi:MFS family permease
VVEKASGRAMMSGFHGFFSIGCILGALAVSGLLSLALTPFLASIAVIAVVLLSLLGISKHLWHDTKSKQGDPMLVMPRGWVIFLGLLCFVMFLTEGAMLDWSALFLITERSVDPHNAGLGYTVFAIAMTLGRLTGDKVINYFGRFKVLLFGSLIACAGLLLSVGVDSLYAVAAGFIMVGLGASNLVPIMFSAAGNQTSMPANLAIASVTTLGYAGILAGPALVGFIAQLSNLSIALSCVAVLMLLVAASARAVTR